MPRSRIHDYKRPSTYHITITKARMAPSFGELRGVLPNVYVHRTPLGNIVANNIRLIPALAPGLAVWQYIVMPDHLHLLLHVSTTLPNHLGEYISKFKNAILRDFRDAGGDDAPIFTPDYYDRILYPGKPLGVVYGYIRSNPYRLAVRREFPEYFRRVNHLDICGWRMMAYGNIQLLDNPFKEQVVVHRRDSQAERDVKNDRWMHTVSNGGVLVSPFISAAEREVRTQAEEAGGKIIHITNTPFGERFKPAEHDFGLCCEGRLLILAPLKPVPLTRSCCLDMNAFAEALAGDV
ncbi:MAG: hypothetical protein K2K49_05690 [Duncaniella sp.]|nr:hypothetical protein [Duncaniella sp.]